MPTSAHDEQVARLLETIDAVLGAQVAGVYLYGSAVIGGLRQASDIDVFVVSRRATTRAQKRALADQLPPISNRHLRPPAWRPIELTIVVASDVRSWHYPPRTDFQYGEWLSADFAAGRLDPHDPTNPDLAVLIAMVLLADTPLRGPHPARLIDPVPHHDLVRAMVAGIGGLVDDIDSDTANVLLTLARIWSTIATGAFRSKDQAANWALERLPRDRRAALEHARAAHLGTADDEWATDREQARRDADYLVREIEALVARAPEDAPGRA